MIHVTDYTPDRLRRTTVTIPRPSNIVWLRFTPREPLPEEIPTDGGREGLEVGE